MRVAVLTLTRDRLDYSRHSLDTLKQHAGCDYDHYVLDNGSTDGSVDWLLADKSLDVISVDTNVGICAGLNFLLANACDPAEYDVIVRFDNDCEVLQPGTLRAVCEVALEYQAIVAPRVLGLLNPPPTVQTVPLGEHRLDETMILGGIFMAIPAVLFTVGGYRYDERNPLASGDEAIVPWWRGLGGRAGYLQGWEVNHYEGTAAQRERFPEYEARKVAEMAA